jgi:NitT/TauT family transport system substrate-binding protein
MVLCYHNCKQLVSMKKKHPHFKTFFVAALAFIAVIVGFSFYLNSQSRDGTHITLDLKWRHNAQFAGFYVAKQNDYYKQAGLSVKFRERQSNKATGIDTLLSGESNFALVTPFELLDSVAQGKPVVAVAAIYQSTPTVIASLTTTNINTPADLKNRVLGITGNEPFRNVIYTALLNQHRVPANTITYKNIGLHPVENLANGSVDAVALYRTDSSYLSEAKDAKLNYLYPENYGLHVYNDVLVTTKQFLEQHPEEARKFVSASLQGWAEALRNQEAAVNATLAYTTNQANDAELQRAILSASAPLIQPDNAGQIGLMTGSRWQEIYEIFRSNIIAPQFDLSTAYDVSFLP